MASPQVEDGYTKIANELLDALIRVPIGNADAQVMYAILRKTYGWSKKEDSISIGQLQEMTNLARRTVIYALKNLEAKNMIVIKRINVNGIKAPSKISFQKNYNKWVVQEKAESYKKTIEKQKLNYRARVVQEIDGSARNGQKVVQEIKNGGVFLAPTKETTTQKKYTKEIKDIIDHLNLRTSKGYKTSSRKTADLIKARMNEGFTVDDFKRVIDNQAVKWLNDPKMCEYLRPETLFGTKFESYLNATPNLSQAGIVSESSAGILGWAERKQQMEEGNGKL